jgi:hypothetical protein
LRVEVRKESLLRLDLHIPALSWQHNRGRNFRGVAWKTL